MKISKRIYLHSFAFVVVVLALVRCGYDYSTGRTASTDVEVADSDSIALTVTDDDVLEKQTGNEAAGQSEAPVQEIAKAQVPVDDGFVPHRIYSVPSYKNCFPDSNEVQLVVAKRYGVPPVQNRKDAEKRKSELVYVGANPYFHVDKLRESIPYLVPRATVLLQDIGRAFFDSLYVKGVPLHQIIVTSVLRTEEDVERLRRHNGNASENSCHRFGTTFDICYNRYHTVQTRDEKRRQVTNDSLKWILSEVLRDMREKERCYIKYEVKQGCFHITTR